MLRFSIRRSFTTVIAFLLVFVGWATSAAAGTLKVTSFPTGAQVIVDGVNTGKLTPMNISLADGDHVVTVQIPGSGWNADTRTVTIAAGNNDLSVTLLPMLSVGPAGPKGDKGDKGDAGAAGTNGSNGANGTSVTFLDYFSGNQHGCRNGGAVYAAGNPPVMTYICNGSDGADATGATRAGGWCVDNVNRYVDCGNGTVSDAVTGLIWLKQADCFPLSDWSMANQAAASLKHGDCGLNDESSPGDWRLPIREEWEAMMVGRLSGVGTLCVPALVNDAWTGCYGDGTWSSLEGVTSGVYWSATTVFTLSGSSVPAAGWAAAADLGNAIPVTVPKTLTRFVWPVRNGQR